MKEPFNLERILHRGKYNVDGEAKEEIKFDLRNVFTNLLGITQDYTLGDKIISYAVFIQSFVWGFLCTFVGVVIWNAITPWPLAWWGHYFFITIIAIPLVFSVVSVFWFGIGGSIDLVRLFQDLKNRDINPFDNGQVEGNVSLADKARFEKIEQAEAENNAKQD
ncbi:hypothetical protein SDC9_117279 [bioreactor metagenome]|uniref:Uncharacterized protein n=1 Tax=bioreactor metagenome TaxID=1076179 RepID=A0A645C852_9ZZZZ